MLNLNANTAAKQPSRSSVLRPLSEIDWLGQSKKSKTSHSADPLNAPFQQQSSQLPRPPTMASQLNSPPRTEHTDMDSPMNNTQAGANLEVSTNYPTPLSPPSEHVKDIGEELIYGNGVAWTEAKERILLGPYDYLYGHPGKDIRSQCIAAFNLWLKVPLERLEIITKVVGMLHTASLL
jgi:geranylgeranyl diphosphate synthase type 3